MPIEIERKFAVIGDHWRGDVLRSRRLMQGYLNDAEMKTARCSVRARIGGDSAWLSVKSAVAGIERAEFEYSVPVADAEHMLKNFADGVIEKIRHEVEYDGFVFEIDEFLGDNAGLIVAEIELDSVDQEFPHPAWLGREVSAERRYYNVRLLRHPYSRWSESEREAHAAASRSSIGE